MCGVVGTGGSEGGDGSRGRVVGCGLGVGGEWGEGSRGRALACQLGFVAGPRSRGGSRRLRRGSNPGLKAPALAAAQGLFKGGGVGGIRNTQTQGLWTEDWIMESPVWRAVWRGVYAVVVCGCGRGEKAVESRGADLMVDMGRRPRKSQGPAGEEQPAEAAAVWGSFGQSRS